MKVGNSRLSVINILFFLACLNSKNHKVNLGVIDVIETSVCTIQLKDESIIEVKSSFCQSFKEGDIIQVIRSR